MRLSEIFGSLPLFDRRTEYLFHWGLLPKNQKKVYKFVGRTAESLYRRRRVDKSNPYDELREMIAANADCCSQLKFAISSRVIRIVACKE